MTGVLNVLGRVEESTQFSDHAKLAARRCRVVTCANANCNGEGKGAGEGNKGYEEVCDNPPHLRPVLPLITDNRLCLSGLDSKKILPSTQEFYHLPDNDAINDYK